MADTRTVMIVDDEAIVALNIRNLLRRQGYEAVSVHSGEECLQKIGQGIVPDMILMDINLGPGRMNGPETTRRVQLQHADIPVILHSAYTDPETIQATRDMTKYGYVHKVPGNEEFVLATVEMAFKLQERERMYRDLSAHVNRLREEQNAFIAREIHDDLGQSIAALKMNLTMLGRSLKDAQLEPIITDMREILDATAIKVRTLIHELRPPVLDTSDIVEALTWHVREFEKTFAIPTSFLSSEQTLELEPEKSLALFRIVQEALTNSARHGEPGTISVAVKQEDGFLRVTVTDDGRGFSPGGNTTPRSYGILGMRERAEQWNGSLTIESVPGQGTSVSASFPIGPEPSGEAS
ncbi:MAG: response regulator [Spirochaetaceae bacterium]|nr:MAG: response regulator [Spirochaetaceae bacterium]